VVAYCLKITDIDPIKYNLLFERFLNPDRISMPDIDIDFDEDDLLESILERFLQNHPCSEDREVLYAGLIDAYLALVEESSEDM